ncbi:MAG: VanW family protein, partial [Nocardioidaceae bacterium]|nr:VanW family protein [Nocardioidaceae bacterium]
AARGRHKGVWWLGGLLVLLGCLYVAGWYFTNSRVPAGTTVEGVDIGGMTAERARDEIESANLTQDYRDIRLNYGDGSYSISSADIFLAVDADQTVQDAGAGRSWNPIRIAETLAGRHGSDVEPVLTWDEAALSSAVGEIAAELETEAAEPAVSFSARGQASVTQPQVGIEVDEDATISAVVEVLAAPRPVQVVASETEPDVTAEELEAALADFQASALQPLTVQLPGRTATLPVSDFASALTLEVQDGELVPLVDTAELSTGVAQLVEGVDVAPVDAQVKLKGGRPVVIPAAPGVRLDVRELASAIASALTQTGEDRTVQVGNSTAKAAFTTKEARDLGIHKVVSRFVTYFPYAEYRNINQARAAELISGTVLEPGELFSFNETVGERTRANGFVKGFIIDGGVFAEDLGGGVSQVVTTTYNAAFFAGLEDVEHKPHSFYIDRYPEGREATVAWPTVDLRFRNDTPYGVLIEAWVEPSTRSSSGEMHVKMWSTKHWDIKAGVSDRYDLTRPATRYDPTDECVATTGYGGFTVDVYRYFREAGSSKIVKRDSDHVVYTPADTVICSKPPG